MRFDAEDVMVTLVDRQEFALARERIDGFEPWASYEDYRDEREGRVNGLSAAGQRALLTPVSVAEFLAWSAAGGLPPSAARLDAFAAIGRASDRRAPPVATAVDPLLYREWLECLGERPSDKALAAYVALIREGGDERSRRSADAD